MAPTLWRWLPNSSIRGAGKDARGWLLRRRAAQGVLLFHDTTTQIFNWLVTPTRPKLSTVFVHAATPTKS